MGNKITGSMNRVQLGLQELGDHFIRAGEETHHLHMGPGAELEAEWTSAGLTLPNLDDMRQYRVDRVRAQMEQMGYDGALLMDPMNIRYTTDTTNMQVWVMHNASRYTWIGLDGSLIVWEFYECDFMAGHNSLITEVRPAVGTTYFLAGPRYEEQTRRWADEILSVIGEHCGPNPHIAIDQCGYLGYKMLEEGGVSIGSGQEMMELARAIKGPDEILAIRCAMAACEATMGEMRESLKPGVTERELWAMLHAGNIRRAGEWIETQILASGPRTNPWMQEASSRTIEDGDLVGYDTDLVGAYGMMVDISRTWHVGDGQPSGIQKHTYDLAREQLDRNSELLKPGASFHDLTHKAWTPPLEDYRHYCVLYHGVGQCDEYPDIVFPEHWDATGFDGVLQPGMVLTTEAYVGDREGRYEGVKLEEQYLITETGNEQLSTFPIDL